MPTLLERLTEKGTSNIIDRDLFRTAMTLYADGAVNAAWIKTQLGLDQPEGAELDEILATIPAAADRPSWLQQVTAIIHAGYAPPPNGAPGDGWPGYETAADLRAALGLAP